MVRTSFVALLTFLAVAVPAYAQQDGAPSRGLVLPALYVSYGALQTYDGLSTVGAVKRGGVESNPLMAGIAGRPAAVWAVKAGVTATAITTAEGLWRRNRRTEAILVMIVANGVMATVALNNRSVVRRLR